MDHSNCPVVYYRMPHEAEVWLVKSKSQAMEIVSLDTISDSKGFILYPFRSHSSAKSYFIPADTIKKITLEELANSTSPDNNWNIKEFTESDSYLKTKEEYCTNVAEAIKEISSGAIQKVVLSRKKAINNSAQNPLKIFHKLCLKYPAAFVSLVYIPGEVLWITATPELLLSAKGNKVSTVSLAGTKPTDSKEAWGEKEKVEQQIVTDYIYAILEKRFKNIIVSGPDEVVAGNIKHLKTSFSAELKNDMWELVSALHPTPAVCGIPQDSAKQFITQTENYDRRYYTGFLGPCNIGEQTNLFVNLRCAELFRDKVNLYIGGGITRDSIPEKEWEETELKSKTLLFAFE